MSVGCGGQLKPSATAASLNPAVWQRIIAAFVDGSIDDAPVAALTMACTIRGMADEEISALTGAMVASGDVLRFAGDRIVVDKHSSGGVGDTISLIVVPLVAACGVPVAKLSGRALGHTGGTLDKLEAVPGVRTDLSAADFSGQIERIGCAIAAQSERLVPADKRLYALRDRTGSVPSIGLIAASIVSKKIAGGAGAIVFDVKSGEGAFMRTQAEAVSLARTMVGLAERSGRRAAAVVTDMNEPLGPAIGSGIEAIEARDFLAKPDLQTRLGQLTVHIAQEMLRVGGISEPEIAGRVDAALSGGAAFAAFIALLEAQGGRRASVVAMAPAEPRTAVVARQDGYLAAVHSVALGEAARDLVSRSGPFAGIHRILPLGTRIRRGDTLAEIAGEVAHGRGRRGVRAGASTAAGARARRRNRPGCPFRACVEVNRSMNGTNRGRTVVTGAAGLIGSALVWQLNREGIEDAIVVDRLGTSEKWRHLVPLQFSDYVEADDLLRPHRARAGRLRPYRGRLSFGCVLGDDGTRRGVFDSQQCRRVARSRALGAGARRAVHLCFVRRDVWRARIRLARRSRSAYVAPAQHVRLFEASLRSLGASGRRARTRRRDQVF